MRSRGILTAEKRETAKSPGEETSETVKDKMSAINAALNAAKKALDDTRNGDTDKEKN